MGVQNKNSEKGKWILGETANYKRFDCFNLCGSGMFCKNVCTLFTFPHGGQNLLLQNQIAELKAAQAPGAAALRSALLDPAVNLLLQRLRQELLATRARLEETQNELSAWKFTPDR